MALAATVAQAVYDFAAACKRLFLEKVTSVSPPRMARLFISFCFQPDQRPAPPLADRWFRLSSGSTTCVPLVTSLKAPFFRGERHLRAVASGDSNCATALGRSHGPEVAVVLVWIPVESLAYRTNTASMPRSRSAWFWGRAWSFAGQGISAVCLDIYKVMGSGVNSTQL